MSYKNIIEKYKLETFPCNEDKSPKTKRGFKDAKYNPEILNDYNVYGIKTGNLGEKSLLVIDVDMNHKNNDGTSLQRWNENFLSLVEGDKNTLTIKTQSGGYHFYYWVDTDLITLQQVKKILDKDIDIKCNGGYVIGFGSTTKKGSYDIINNTDINDFPNELLPFIFKEDSSIGNSSASFDITDEVRELMKSGLDEEIGNGKFDEYEDWLKLGIALKNSGFELQDWIDLSEKPSKNMDTKWYGFRTEKTFNFGTLLNFLEEDNEYKTEIRKMSSNDVVLRNKSEAENHFTDEALITFDNQYAKIQVGKDIFVINKIVPVNHSGQLDIITPRSFSQKYSRYIREFSKPNGEVHSVNLADVWFKYTKSVYDGLDIDFKEDLIFTKHNKTYLNLWRGLKITPTSKSYNKEKIERILDWKFNVLCNGREDVFEYLNMFDAKMLFNPEKRNGVAIIFYSLPGAGKSTYNEVMKKIIPDNFITLPKNLEKILSGFNSSLFGKVLCFVEEQTSIYNKSGINSLKDVITNNKIEIERKGLDTEMANNYLHFVFSTNEEHVLNATIGERRLIPIKVNEKYAKMRKTNPAEQEKYFNELYNDINNPEIMQEYMNYLSTFAYEKFSFNKELIADSLPELKEQSQYSLSADALFIQHSIENPDDPISIYRQTKELKIGEETLHYIESKDLYDCYKTFCESYGHKGVKTENKFIGELRKKELFIVKKTKKARYNIVLPIKDLMLKFNDIYNVYTNEEIKNYDDYFELPSVEPDNIINYISAR